MIRIASIVLRACATLALILGLLFWSGNGLSLVMVHMLLGLGVVLSLLAIGFGQAFAPGGSWAGAVAALVMGGVVIWFGMNQTALLPGQWHWVIRVIHLLLGVAAVGIGQAIAARGKPDKQASPLQA
jgi:hypothetical protein